MFRLYFFFKKIVNLLLNNDLLINIYFYFKINIKDYYL